MPEPSAGQVRHRRGWQGAAVLGRRLRRASMRTRHSKQLDVVTAVATHHNPILRPSVDVLKLLGQGGRARGCDGVRRVTGRLRDLGPHLQLANLLACSGANSSTAAGEARPPASTCPPQLPSQPALSMASASRPGSQGHAARTLCGAPAFTSQHARPHLRKQASQGRAAGAGGVPSHLLQQE